MNKNVYQLQPPAFNADVKIQSFLIYAYLGLIYVHNLLVFSALCTPDCRVIAWKFLVSWWHSGVNDFLNLNPPSRLKSLVTCDLASTPAFGLALVQVLEPAERAGKLNVYLQAYYRFYFPEGETKVSKVYRFACSHSVSRQRIGNKTNFLASFPTHPTPYLVMPTLDAKNPSQGI